VPDKLPEESDREASYAAWMSDEILLALGTLEVPAGEFGAVLSAGEEEFDAHARCLSLKSREAPGVDRREWKVVVAAVPGGARARGRGDLALRASREHVPDKRPALLVAALPTLIEACQAALDPTGCQRVLDFICASARAHGRFSILLSKSLLTVREGLRSQPHRVVVDPERHQGGAVELVGAASDRAFYIQGWVHDSEAPLTRLTVLSPEGERAELLDDMFRYSRPDIDELYHDPPSSQSKAGFIAFVELEAPSYLQDGWVLEVENEAATEGLITTSRVVQDVVLGRRAILERLPFDELPNERLMATKVFPAIDLLQQRARELVEVASVRDYGRPVSDPEISIVIPLYERIQFLEHQLAQFVSDPEITDVELVYVLDSPELAKPLRDYASHLFRLYRIPFRVVTMAHTGGFSGATNCGVAESRGRLLLLLNSDVIPAGPGWLGRMREFYDSQERIGALGVKLLYEDDALQHAGLYFEYVEDTALAGAWANAHYFKGMNRDLPAANVARRVPAVTGACLMISRELFERAGGLPDIYVQGDHEDSELCLRLIEAGCENWYLPAVELYHLEGQSYESTFRGMTALYNRWLHTHRWGELIGAVMADYPRPGAAPGEGGGDRAFPIDAGMPAER
jgi:GT2 family glycosyltransferase